MSNKKIPCAVYKTKDIQALFACGINEVERLVELGVIPRPIQAGGKYCTRRWAKSVVDKKLGLTPQDEIRRLVREILSEEHARTAS